MSTSEVVVVSKLLEALAMVLSSSDTPVESLSMMSLDMLAASKLELVSKDVASAMDDGLVSEEPEELMLLPNSVLTVKVSLLAVRGVATEVISDDVVPGEVSDGTLSDEKTSTSPEPSNSVVPETKVAPCQKTNFTFRDTSNPVHIYQWKLPFPTEKAFSTVISQQKSNVKFLSHAFCYCSGTYTRYS
jgi:hypothetical protein